MKNLYFIRVAAALLLVLFISSTLHAQTNISGTVSGTWTLSGSPYLIVGDANVPAGSILMIEAGVSVKFTGEYVLQISGNLQAIGTVQDKIEFTSITSYTKGLHIINGQDTCRLKYCTFQYFNDRSEMVNGGAVYASNTKIAIVSCEFIGNHLELHSVGCRLGGAICLESCTGYLINSLIHGNGISNPYISEDITGKGGGIYNSGNVEIKNNEISGNYINLLACPGSSAWASAYGGGVWTDSWVHNNYIHNNYCKSIASAEDWGGSPVTAEGLSEGGGIYGGSLISNNLIVGNYCRAEGYAWSYQGGFSSGTATSRGGGIMWGTIQNNTVISNNVIASADNLIILEGSGVYGGTLINSIVYNNLTSPQVNSSTATYSCIQWGYTGTGNISSDPLFVTGPDGMYYLSQLAAGQSQQSPCVDAGNPATPLFPGKTRTDGFPDVGIIDMGYHYPWPYHVAQLNIKVMLQGPFAGTGMQTNLNNFNYLPLAQPFQGPPWNYNGTESVTAIPNNTIVDWVLLELRQAPGASQALPGTMLCRQACFVNNTGKITGLNGNASEPVSLTMPQLLEPGNGLFVIVWHRNHLGVLSAEPMQETGLYTYSYDFTTGADKAYGGVNGHIEVGQGIWGMVSGDGDANCQVNNVDKVEVWKPQGGFSGYRAGDFNLDGQVNNQDKIDHWTPNGGRSCQVSFTMPGSLPTVITGSVSNINCCSAEVTGEVTAEGSYPVTDRGFCYDTSPYPSLYNSHSNNGSGSGSFTEILSGLNPQTTYFVRAYATSILGTTYGSQKSFTTLVPLPVVTTSPITNITDIAATGGGDVIDEGASPVTARGVCWSTSQNPTLNDPHTMDGSGAGVFVSQLTGLSPLTTYYVRAYATNQAGTSYGTQVNFNTSAIIVLCAEPTITYGGQIYNTVQIGTQCWLKENLNIGTMITGGTNQTNNGSIEKYCYDNIETNCTLYGGLYQWDEMMQYVTTPGQKGICPDGWHLPTDEEWKFLEGYADSLYSYPDPIWNQTGWRGYDAGKNLKSVYGWDSNGNGTDLFGFTVLPGGYWMYYGFFGNMGTSALFWTSSENNTSNTWYRQLNANMDKIYRQGYYKADGHSVRCLKD